MIGLRSRAIGPDERDDEVIRHRPEQEGVTWTRVLVWFMRGLSAVWLVKGLAAWAAIFGLTAGSAPSFEGAPIGLQTAVVYFAVIDLAAAVGLWFTSIWGGVLWMLAVMSHLILAVFFPRVMANSVLVVGFFIVAIMMYLTISWLSASEDG